MRHCCDFPNYHKLVSMLYIYINMLNTPNLFINSPQNHFNCIDFWTCSLSFIHYQCTALFLSLIRHTIRNVNCAWRHFELDLRQRHVLLFWGCFPSVAAPLYALMRCLPFDFPWTEALGQLCVYILCHRHVSVYFSDSPPQNPQY